MNNRKGQVLLIAVMLLATVITVVMTIAFNATTETQVARLEADSQKALAAAEAGIDAVIEQSVTSGTVIHIDDEDRQFKDQGITGEAQVRGETKPYFVTPLLQKDEQYTFYLSDYPGFANPWNGSFDLYLESETTQCPSIEVVIIKDTNEQDRYTYNTCSPDTGTIKNALLTTKLLAPHTIDSTNFLYKISDSIQVPIAADITSTGGKIAFVKVLNGRTKIGFESTNLTVPFPIQGKTIESEARTESGVVKKVQLFQSFPQIPSNFFMTSF